MASAASSRLFVFSISLRASVRDSSALGASNALRGRRVFATILLYGLNPIMRSFRFVLLFTSLTFTLLVERNRRGREEAPTAPPAAHTHAARPGGKARPNVEAGNERPNARNAWLHHLTCEENGRRRPLVG
jgi:hypothetical protein